MAGRDAAVGTAPSRASYLGCTVLHVDGKNLPAPLASDVCDE